MCIVIYSHIKFDKRCLSHKDTKHIFAIKLATCSPQTEEQHIERDRDRTRDIDRESAISFVIMREGQGQNLIMHFLCGSIP